MGTAEHTGFRKSMKESSLGDSAAERNESFV